MPYAIMRFAKKKAGGLGSAYAHNERKKESYKSNPDIDMERSADNYHLVQPHATYRKEAFERIRAAGCKTRSDSTVMVETLITASPDFMSGLPPPEQREYFSRALDFMADRIGKQNIIAATVHMDERNPHMHLSFCPITEDRRLSAKSILGNQASLSKWQTDYHAHMSKRWPELERGISSMITKRKHIPQWMFKQAERLDKQVSQIEAALVDINPLNAKKKRETAMNLLVKWLPEAERFTVQVKTIGEHVKTLEQAEAGAEKRAREAKKKADVRVDSAVAHMQTKINRKDKELLEADKYARELMRQIHNQETLIGKIPLEVRDKIMNQIKKERGVSR